MSLPKPKPSARSCAIEMMNSALFIRQELPALKMPDALRNQIEDLCDEWIGCKHDVISELDELAECAAKGNQARVARKAQLIRSWLIDSAGKSEPLVKSILEAKELGEVDPALSILVMESAVNILNSLPPIPSES